MKLVSFFLVIFFLVIIIAGVSFFYYSSNESTRDDKQDGQEYDKQEFSASEESLRKEIFNNWLSAGDDVVKRTKNEFAASVMDFLRNSSYLSVPFSNNTSLATVIVEDPDGKSFGVVPLLPKDENVSDPWKDAYNSNFAAFFVQDPGLPSMILKEDSQFSEVWKGLILIREGVHAVDFTQDIFSSFEDHLTRRSVEEYYAYELQIDLVEQIGGHKYTTLVAEEVKRFKGIYLENKQILIPDYVLYASQLAGIFGESKSSLETDVRNSVFWINAVFRLLDEVSANKDEALKKKVDFLFSAYQNDTMD